MEDTWHENFNHNNEWNHWVVKLPYTTNKQFVCDLAHTSDLHVQIDRLKTGYSKEIDGQVNKSIF